MPINGGCRLGAAIAIGVIEIERGDAMLTEGARECSAAVHRFGGVISHSFIVVLRAGVGLGQQECDLRAGDRLRRLGGTELPGVWSELNSSFADASPHFS